MSRKGRFTAAAVVLAAALALAAGAVYASEVLGGGSSDTQGQSAGAKSPDYGSVFSGGGSASRAAGADVPPSGAVITRASRQEIARGVAQVIGITERDLVKAYSGGQNLTQIASDHGVSKQMLRDGLIAYENNALLKAVAGSQITQQQSDLAARAFATEIDRILAVDPGAVSKN